MSTHLSAEFGRRSTAVVAAFGAPTMATAAQLLVAAGVPVFPSVPSTKRPLTRHGFLDATVDPAEASRIWRQWPETNLANPTGHASGFDVDMHDGESGRPAFDRSLARGLTADWAFTVRTPSGGLHAYYPSSEAEQSSWQVPSTQVDFRGAVKPAEHRRKHDSRVQPAGP